MATGSIDPNGKCSELLKALTMLREEATKYYLNPEAGDYTSAAAMLEFAEKKYVNEGCGPPPPPGYEPESRTARLENDARAFGLRRFFSTTLNLNSLLSPNFFNRDAYFSASTLA